MKNKKGIHLLKKYLSGKSTLEEDAAVDTWYESVDESGGIGEPEDLSHIKEQLLVRTWNQLRSGARVVPFNKNRLFKVAASIVLILSGGPFFYYFIGLREAGEGTSIAESVAPTLKHDVSAPDASKATLTLADGSVIVLDSVATGSSVQDGNTRIKKLANGEIVYDGSSGTEEKIQFNTLTVPKGSKPMQLKLADGSRAWVNVASSITYPIIFNETERKVKVTGEVYFEVTSISDKRADQHETINRIPFVVSASSRLCGGDELTVKVLGTHFNVNAYDDEQSLKVTLLEGAVSVEKSGVKSLYLKPDQQAELSRMGDLKLNRNIDIDEVMSWKNNWFVFNRMTVQEIMRQIEKWYDVTVSYEHPVSNKHFSGIVSRDNNVSEALKIMEQAGIKFKIEGKNITVM